MFNKPIQSLIADSRNRTDGKLADYSDKSEPVFRQSEPLVKIW